VDFWRTNRLNYQLELAACKGYTGILQTQGEQLLADMHLFFSDYTPLSSLLHGDLWAGNYGIDTRNQPVLFDPAVYYGDREVDIAMTELFGGFPNRFYQAYQDTFPLDSGYVVRKKLYNLYYILNNLNTFGGGYLRQAEGIILGLLSELH
jgi:fructosamine-3-kinase